MPPMLTSQLSAFGYIIRHIEAKVNRKISYFTQSKRFVRWFGDWQNNPKKTSKVVNADGTPKILYHQTAEEFDEFDTRRKGAGYNDDETPFGIFMKPTADDIGLKGKKQMALYARIVSPLMVSDRADLADQLKKMSPTYKQLIGRLSISKIKNKMRPTERSQSLDTQLLSLGGNKVGLAPNQ